MIDVEKRELFVQALEQQLGRSLAPHVHNAFLLMPRHLFVHQYYEQQGNSLNWKLVQATPERVYRDEALVTQLDRRGMPSSSTSQPSIMAAQLEALALEPDQRVLEVGVGTGYNAALIGAIVGHNGQVISIDIDESLVEQAKQHLAHAKSHNVIALPGDGFSGEATYAPYDRLLATCGIRFIPHAWFEQLKIGGKLVGNWLTSLASLFLCVEKTSTDKLEGGLLDLSASYMEMHSEGVVPAKQKIDWKQYDVQSPTSVPLPHIKALLQNAAYSLLLQCFLPQIRKRYRSKGDQVNLYLVVQEAAVQVQDNQLLIFGRKDIGQIIQQSVDLYHHFGEPHLSEYRVTFKERDVVIAIGGQHFHFPLN